jgi:hypothetical protein
MSLRYDSHGVSIALRSLAEVQLQAQVARSATLDAQAMGVMGLDAALAAILLGRPADSIGIVALTILGLSAGIAGRSLFFDSKERIGPSVTRLLGWRDIYDDNALDEQILRSLTSTVGANEIALGRREPRLAGAFVLLALSATLVLVTGLY